jgi:hypothetical protein
MNTIILMIVLILILCCGVLLYQQRHEIKLDMTEFKDPETGRDYRDTGHLIVYVNNSDVSPALTPDDTAIIRQNLGIQDLFVGDIVYTSEKKFFRVTKVDTEKGTLDLMNNRNEIRRDLGISYITGKLIGKGIS